MYVEVRILYVCHKFDIALDICTIRDIRHKISAHFNCVVLNRKYAVISFLLRVLFILHIVYSVLHIFLLLPHAANKLNHLYWPTQKTPCLLQESWWYLMQAELWPILCPNDNIWLPWKQGGLTEMWTSPLDWPTPKNPVWCKNLGPILSASRVMVNFGRQFLKLSLLWQQGLVWDKLHLLS